jgi:hypothetical protein
VIRGLEKNAFASMSYSLVKMCGFSTFFVLVFFVPLVAALLLPLESATGFLAALILLHITFARLSVAFGGSMSVMPGLLFGAGGVLFAFWRSAFLTLLHGGVTWRETFAEGPSSRRVSIATYVGQAPPDEVNREERILTAVTVSFWHPSQTIEACRGWQASINSGLRQA